MKIFALSLAWLGSVVAWGAPTSYPVLTEKTPFTGSQLLVPNSEERHASVVMLHGSEGGSAGFIEAEAYVLATLGYRVLMLCYFDCNRGMSGPREPLKNVDPKIVLDAVAWLRTQKGSNGIVAVYGFSRGAELALISGSLDATKEKRPDALIAHAPSDLFNGPFSWSWLEAACWLCRRGQGSCPPGTPDAEFDWNLSCGEDPRFLDFSLSAWLPGGKPVPAGQRIEVEKFTGPILLTVGEKDETWPSAQTERIEYTLRLAGRRVQTVYFPGGGHVLNGADEIRRRELVLEFLGRL